MNIRLTKDVEPAKPDTKEKEEPVEEEEDDDAL
jgi:hypothetical protein